jgi:hypothetical protein
MNAANVGAVVEMEDFVRIVGIVTERDLRPGARPRSEGRVLGILYPDPASSRIGGFRGCFASDKLGPWTRSRI